MGQIGKLQVNVPRIGTIKAIYYAKSQNPEYGDQIKIVGAWENEGEGQFWLPLPVIQHFTEAGVAAQLVGQVDKDGFARFAVVNARQRVFIKKAQDGKKNVYQVLAIDAQGNQVTLNPQPYPPVLNQPTPAAAAASGPVAPAAPGAVAPPAPGAVAPPAAGAAPITTAAAVHEQLSPEERKQRARRGWADLEERYGCALAIAAYQQLRLAQAKDPAKQLDDLEAAVIQAGAATILIESSKSFVPVIPGLAKALFGRLAPGATNGKHEDPRGVAKASNQVAGAIAPAKQAEAFDDFDQVAGEAEEDDSLPF